MIPPGWCRWRRMLELRLGSLRLSVNVLFLASLLALMLADGGEIALWCLAASLMHESGHVVAALLWWRQPVWVELGAFGMRMQQTDATVGYHRQIAVLLAGPMVNLASAAALALTGRAGMAVGVPLVIGVFNLLPIEPLDGGQALLCLLSQRGDPDRAGRLVFGLSLCLLFGLLVFGFTVLLAGGYNFTLLAVTLYENRPEERVLRGGRGYEAVGSSQIPKKSGVSSAVYSPYKNGRSKIISGGFGEGAALPAYKISVYAAASTPFSSKRIRVPC